MQRRTRLQRLWQRERRQENNWNTRRVLYFRNPNDSSIPSMMLKTPPGHPGLPGHPHCPGCPFHPHRPGRPGHLGHPSHSGHSGPLVILVLWSSWSSGHPGQPSLPRQPGRPGHPGHPHHSVTPLLHQHFQPCYTLLHPITPCLEMWNGLFFVISQQPINEIANWFHYLVCQILHSILVLIGWGICPRFGEGSQ